MINKVNHSIFEDKKICLFIVVFFGIVNIFSINVRYLGTFISIFEYAIIYYFIFIKNPLSAYIAFVIFNSVSFEFDSFLYLGDAPFTRGSFFDLPVIRSFPHIITTLVLLREAKLFSGKSPMNPDGAYFLKWLLVLLVLGGVQGLLCLLFNDNGTSYSPSYPIVTFLEFLNFSSLFAFIWAGFLLAQLPRQKYILTESCLMILLGLCFISFIGVLLGYEAFSNEQENGNLLAPLATLFVPFLLTFYRKRKYSVGIVFVTLSIIVLCFFKPNVMGSKWYLVIISSLFVVLMNLLRIKKVGLIICFGLFGLFVISQFSEILVSFLSNNSYNEWKAKQAFGAINLFQYNSLEEWFLNLEPSAAYRIDELLNIGIEYINKPLYALFGKGFGGTTLHYTPYLFWESGGGNFSDAQIQIGAYYAMHESLAVIFLRHGIIGIVFFIDMLIRQIKRIPTSNWALLGVLWFFLFWKYGCSFWIGAFSIVLGTTNTPSKKRTQTNI